MCITGTVVLGVGCVVVVLVLVVVFVLVVVVGMGAVVVGMAVVVGDEEPIVLMLGGNVVLGAVTAPALPGKTGPELAAALVWDWTGR
jgi:hypothetical protein